MSKMKINNSQKGFAIFAAVIIAGLLATIAFSISSLSSKQVSLANLNRESGQAIFAANAGIECALFWDSKYILNPGPPIQYGSAFSTTTATSITCNNTNISGGQATNGTTTLSRIGGGGNANPTSVFGFSLNTVSQSSSACAVVTVRKYYSGGNLTTHIYSYGYNTCDITNTRRVERGIEVRF